MVVLWVITTCSSSLVEDRALLCYAARLIAPHDCYNPEHCPTFLFCSGLHSLKAKKNDIVKAASFCKKTIINKIYSINDSMVEVTRNKLFLNTKPRFCVLFYSPFSKSLPVILSEKHVMITNHIVKAASHVPGCTRQVRHPKV